MISQYFFRHQGVARYESRDAPEGKTDALPPLTKFKHQLRLTYRIAGPSRSCERGGWASANKALATRSSRLDPHGLVGRVGIGVRFAHRCRKHAAPTKCARAKIITALARFVSLNAHKQPDVPLNA